ncbi:type III pantothenate kinase [Urechidicola croceus]|uniref:Type III pantothenate kinase n=1 Tax=Urechidicola croceus TaxID=1850246 RepID=A0A1D8P7A2_9FLAO|nr:type III pantothenate kinase [Urechidicola croceus]AOW20418.1 pantothenate kinase [Urechidicola croceus]
MNLAIDVGNTRVKVALFEENNIQFQTVFDKEIILEKLEKISKKNKVYHAIISSVANISENDLFEIEKMFVLIQLNHEIELPFNNKYATPKTLGVDRIALAAAAINNFPNENVLVIDAGTCITYDYISEKKKYYGGAISPGIEMRYKALHTFTDKLPLLKTKYPKDIIGNNTENSIHSGVVHGILAEIKGVIDQYKQQNKKLTVVLTGGDTYFLAKRLKNGIFANPNFLLEGLNTILNFNIKND